MNDRAGQRPGYAGDSLDLGYHEPAELIDVLRFRANDYVVRTSHIVSLGHAVDLPDGHRHRSSLPDFCLDEDVSLDHVTLRSSV